jgi:hypothetical protein
MRVTIAQAQSVAEMIGFNFSKFDFDQFRKGLAVEMEHINTVKGNVKIIGLIVLDHLKEHPRYYDFLEEAEGWMKASKRS